MTAPSRFLLVVVFTSLFSLTSASLTRADFVTFTSSSEIVINDNAVASPYPATINVSGVTFTPVHFTLTLTGVSHTWINDVAAAIVSPQGVRVLLFTGTGPEGNEIGPYGVTNQTWTFDDLAPTQLPQSVLPVSGTYRPGMRLDLYEDDFPGFGTVDTFNTNFSQLVGVSPNGTWSLLIRDSQRSDRGNIAGGWSMTFSDTVAVPEPGSMLMGALGLAGCALVRRKRGQVFFRIAR